MISCAFTALPSSLWVATLYPVPFSAFFIQRVIESSKNGTFAAMIQPNFFVISASAVAVAAAADPAPAAALSPAAPRPSSRAQLQQLARDPSAPR